MNKFVRTALMAALADNLYVLGSEIDSTEYSVFDHPEL